MSEYPSCLVHFGIKGQKHGIRKYQNEDGTLTPEGKIRYGKNGVSKKPGVYSAKIDNYHKGNLFRQPYYVDKRGKKRSYLSYKEMPYESQNRERRMTKGRELTKKYGKVALIGAAGVAASIGAAYYMHKHEYHIHFKDLGIRIHF